MQGRLLKMNEYKVIADRLNIRSVLENNKPRYIIKATGAIANKKHITEYFNQPDGSVKTLKSMFTPHCIESIKRQSKNKGVFVDIQHELARESSMKAMVKGKLTDEEQTAFNRMIKTKRLPLMKMNEIDILDDKLDLELELNSMFPEVDDEHKRLYDAVVYSLQNKFLNGVSVTFGEFKCAKNDEGVTVIDDVEVLGFSCLDTPAEHMNSIYEVAIRAIEDKTGENKMDEEEKKKFEEEKNKLEDEKKKFEEEKIEAQKVKDEADKTTEEEKKQAEIKIQEEKQTKIEEDLAKKTEELKKVEDDLNSAKGLAAKGQEPPTGAASDKGLSGELYEKNLKEITSLHDQTIETIKAGKLPIVDNRFKNFSEIINLQAKAGDLTADLDKENAEFVNSRHLLDKGRADIITPKLRQE